MSSWFGEVGMAAMLAGVFAVLPGCFLPDRVVDPVMVQQLKGAITGLMV